MSFCSSSDNVSIPEEISAWGESHLEPNNLYRVVGNQLYSSMPWDELKSMYSNVSST